MKRKSVIFTALSAFLFVPHVGAGAESNAVTAFEGAIRTQYLTTLGPITLEVPNGFVGLSQVDPAAFDLVVAPFRKGGLQTVEIFVTADSWRAAKPNGASFRDLIALQLPATNTPPMDDALWKSVRAQMLTSIAGNDAAEWIDSAERPAVKRFNEVHNHDFIRNIDVGKVVIYQAAKDDLRWIAKSIVTHQTDKGPATYTAVIASALIRKERQLFFLQSVASEPTDTGHSNAAKKLDLWISALR